MSRPTRPHRPVDDDGDGQRVARAPWPEDTLPPFLTIPECAALLRTTPKAIEHLIRRRHLPGVLRPARWGRVLIKTADVIAWISSSASSSEES